MAANNAKYRAQTLSLLKHQICLTVGLIKNQQQTSLLSSDDDEPKNILLSPHLSVSALTCLCCGSKGDARAQLVNTLLCPYVEGKWSVNKMLSGHCARNGSVLSKNKHTLLVDTFLYRAPSRNRLKTSQKRKYASKYQCLAMDLPFTNNYNENPFLNALGSINQNFVLEPEMMDAIHSATDYVNSQFNSRIGTILINSAHFKSLWSKDFELVYGIFRKANGEPIQTEFLFKKKSFLYYEDRASMSKSIKINFESKDVSIILIMPQQEKISLNYFVKHTLDYKVLRRIIKNLTTRYDVCLTLPVFSFTSKTHITQPVQLLGSTCLRDYQEYDAIRSVDDKVVLVQRLALELDLFGARSSPGLKSQLFSLREAQFVANRPFLFLIVTRDDFGDCQQILFAGVCNDPTVN